MSKKRTAEYSPATCTFNQLTSIGRDNISAGDFWMLTDTRTVWLNEQPEGEMPKQAFAIPRPVFNKLVRWYLRPQKRVR